MSEHEPEAWQLGRQEDAKEAAAYDQGPEPDSRAACDECDGEGIVLERDEAADSTSFVAEEICPACNGTGKS